jgi:signal transduction histidine kinase
VLEAIVRGDVLADILAELCRIVEDEAGGQVRAAIMLVDAQRRLRSCAAPSLPDHYNAAVDGIGAAEGVGTCAHAAATGQIVVTRDFATDRGWEGLAHLPLAIGLKAAWSMPVTSASGEVLATFGTYFPECREPTSLERDLVAVLAQTAALAIERDRRDASNAELYERLRDQDRRKDEFLATLAHELRNPLAPIRTGLHILRMTTDPVMAAKSRDVMERQLGHLVRLRRRPPRRLAHHARQGDAVAPAASTCGRSSTTRWNWRDRRSTPMGHTLALQVPDQALLLDGDATRLAQVLANLLNNAAKYTPSGGRVSLDVEQVPETLIVRVSDNGIGIPADMLDRVFDMFTQLDASIDRSQGGLGIGLTLVRRLVELHGGTVEVHSDGPGTGSTVSPFTCPLRLRRSFRS